MILWVRTWGLGSLGQLCWYGPVLLMSPPSAVTSAGAGWAGITLLLLWHMLTGLVWSSLLPLEGRLRLTLKMASGFQ